MELRKTVNRLNVPLDDKKTFRRTEYPQILLGGVTGLTTGLIIAKIGKTAAVLVGSSIILVEIASLEGLIKIDWFKVSEQICKFSDKIQQILSGKRLSWFEGSRNFTTANSLFAFSFIGGAFLGLGLA